MDLKHLEIRLERATTLPIFSGAVSQVLALTQNLNAGTRDYERAISQDAALSAKILRTANSPYFGGNGQITSLQRAMAQLGSNTLRSICMAVAFQSALGVKTLNKRFDFHQFWKHSMAVACAAKVLALLTRDPQAEEAFIAGLLHDVGKLALCMFMPLEANQVYTAMEEQHISQFEAELACLQLTHQEIGRLAAQRWQLPPLYHEPIAKHHTPAEDGSEIDRLTALVHVGNALAYEVGLGSAPAGCMNSADPQVVDFLGISPAQFEPLKGAITMEVAKLGAQLIS
jgi:HD-like signal output (HDOD) protein